MPRVRDPALLAAAMLVIVVTWIGVLGSTDWVGRPFPGFLLLDNRIIASAGLSHWPATASGEIYQHEIESVDGRPLGSASELSAYVESLPIGTPVDYALRRGTRSAAHTIATRRFSAADYVVLFGAYLVCGVALAGVGLTIRFLGGRNPLTQGASIPLLITGLWALSATDLYGPYHLFRLHALLECFLFAGAIHFALAFPYPRPVLERHPHLIPVLYGLAAILSGITQLGLYDPAVYVATHSIAMTAFGVGLVGLIGSQIDAYARPPDYSARQRVKIVTLGSVAALGPHVGLLVLLAVSGGQAPVNAMGWSGIFFPVAVGYAVLKQDLLQVDAFLRRSLSYALLTGILAAGYVVAAAGFDVLVREQIVDSRGLFAILFAAVSVIGLLPLRDWLQAQINRVFSRNAYDFRQLLETSSRRLASVGELSEIARVVDRTVTEALDPAWLTLEVKRGEATELERVLSRGDTPAPDAGHPTGAPGEGEPVAARPPQLEVPIRVEDRLVGLLRLGPRRSGRYYGGDDRSLLDILANNAGPAIENALAIQRLQDLNRSLERNVEERTSELRSALEELRTAKDHLVHQEKMASLGQLVAGIAHEINNPVNFIQGNLHFIRTYSTTLVEILTAALELVGELDPESERYLREIAEQKDLGFILKDLDSTLSACEEGSTRTTDIVQGLRIFSRGDESEAVRADLVEILESTLVLLRSPLTGLEIVRELEPLPTIECFAGQLGQVFMNLICNAADAVEGQGTITIRTRNREDEGRVVIEIEDDGCGIPEAQRDRIFEPFYTTKDVGKGTGLGLAISYGVVVRHGGKIRVHSEPGRGTRFEVALPTRLDPPEDTSESAKGPA